MKSINKKICISFNLEIKLEECLGNQKALLNKNIWK
jgi:hypothetical protein